MEFFHFLKNLLIFSPIRASSLSFWTSCWKFPFTKIKLRNEFQGEMKVKAKFRFKMQRLWNPHTNGINFQSMFPFLAAGAGMVGAGLLLDHAASWSLFESTPETFILVPALLGLKGNLEMTLASRLSTMVSKHFNCFNSICCPNFHTPIRIVNIFVTLSSFIFFPPIFCRRCCALKQMTSAKITKGMIYQMTLWVSEIRMQYFSTS